MEKEVKRKLFIGLKFKIDNLQFKIVDIQEKKDVVFAEYIGKKSKKGENPEPDMFSIKQVENVLTNKN